MHRRLVIASCRRNDRCQRLVRAAVVALAQQQSRCEQRWRRLLLVRGARLTPELGDARLRA
jgi:hypothetical protein